MNKCEERIKSILKIYDDRLQDSRVENSHYNLGLEKKNEQIRNEINKLSKIQEDLKKKYEYQLNEREEKIKYYNNELLILNNKINKMNSLI